MTFIKGSPKPASSGRKKGVKNRLNAMRDAFIEVFERRGQEGIEDWAKADPSGFYKTCSGFVPKEIKTDVDGKIEIRWAKQ